MEGAQLVSSKLRFVESKKKFRLNGNFNNPSAKKLIAYANSHGLVILGCGDNSIKAAPIELFSDKSEIVNLTQFSFIVNLSFKPTLVTVARYGFSSVVLVCGVDENIQCPVVEAIDLDTQASIGSHQLPELAGSDIADYAWHPNYYDSVVALCTNRGCLLTVGISRKGKFISMLYNDSVYGALTCCWSPKGKNLAIGLINGKILRLEPIITADSFNYKEVDKSLLTFNHIKPDHQVTKLRWVNKTFLMSVHSRPNNPGGAETIYSLITIKPGKPFLYWTNLIFENQTLPNYEVHLVNFSNSVLCMSNASGEAAVIGVDGAKEANTNELNDWRSIIIDEEGARIEMPLDGNNRETFPLGMTTAMLKSNAGDQPIVLLLNSDGVICPYLANHSENILKLPEFQQPQDCPVVLKPPPKQSAPQQQNFASWASLNQQSLPTLPQPTFNPTASILKLPEPQQTQTSPIVLKESPKPAPQQQQTFSSWASLSQQVLPTLPQPNLQSPFNLKESMLKLSDFQQPQDSPLKVETQKASPQQQPVPIQNSSTSTFSTQPPLRQTLTIQPLTTQNVPSQPLTTQTIPSQSVTAQPPTLTQSRIPSSSSSKSSELQQAEDCKKFLLEISAIKKAIESNQLLMTSLDDVNSLRVDFDQIQEIHKIHGEALESVKEDVDNLDIGMLENLYLIEYIKTRSKIRRKSINPLINKKVDGFKLKSKVIETKLRDLENNVEAAWQEFVRRNSPQKNNRKINTLDLIYKTLANNQKVIKFLKEKVGHQKSILPDSSSVAKYSSISVPVVNVSKMRSFRDYLSSRGVAPVRRPGK